uniref:Uncharacterized protein n=1 Tax=Rangifer tarandus platyrhynchus TaxID=3082113 RepID=A0ACB0FHB7_RANTA|nr:unnamed protein product [Rangifer tarandus platyrhynchus]
MSRDYQKRHHCIIIARFLKILREFSQRGEKELICCQKCERQHHRDNLMQIAAVTAAQRTFRPHLERTGLPGASPDSLQMETWSALLPGLCPEEAILTPEHRLTVTLVGPENSRQGSGRGAQAGCSHKAERSTAASVTATLAKASQRCRKPQFPQGLLKPRGVPRRVNSFYAGQAGNKTRLLTGLSIMETLTQTKSKGLSLGAQAGSPRLWDGRSWGSCSHSWKKVHADGALDDWKPDASKGRSGYEIMSRELTEQRRATRAPRGSEKLRRCARCQQGLREETLLPARFYLLRDPWPGGWGAEGAPSPSCSAAVHAHDQRTSNEMRWPALWGTGSSTLFR